MNKYTAPAIEIFMFNEDMIITASGEVVETKYTGGQIELPDHEWE